MSEQQRVPPCQIRAHYPLGDHALCADEFHRCDGGPPGEAASYNPALHVADSSPCWPTTPESAPVRPHPRIRKVSSITGESVLRRDTVKYRTIVVDPPWEYRQKWGGGRELSSRFFKGGTDRGAACMYSVMDQAALLALPVNEWAEDNAHLYLWTTNAFILDAHVLMAAWGFQYKTMLTWCKNQIGMGMYFRNTTEHVLFGVRGSLKCLRRDVLTHFTAPRGRHSEKPAAFYDIVESMSPGPRLDVFARKHRFGSDGTVWDTFGDEVFNPPHLLDTLTDGQRAGLTATPALEGT